MVQRDAIRPCLVRDVRIDIDGVSLAGRLTIPENARSIVLFVHGSGSSRHSPRNQFVAEILQAKGMATLLFDLLTAGEEDLDQRTASLRFDIDLLTRRLIGATAWTNRNPLTQGLRIGYFGASTGAAAALAAAARIQSVAAVVSRGGRPDLAGDALGHVLAPALFIVGGRDETVLELNRRALAQLHSRQKRLVVIPGATHLFEEPGTLAEVAKTAAEWFVRHLTGEGAESREPLPNREQLHSGR
ncbi:MAG: alpha/beta hydrolase [Acidobacteria bacterium]|nr:alpha/beta hydrolase [Acidobacteriota bacterium]